jgi:hypothetical protein
LLAFIILILIIAMPVINYSNPRDAKWIQNAEREGDIPLHPLGELDISDYSMAASGDQAEQRKRLTGIQIEIVAAIFLIYLFAQNLVITCRLLMSRSPTLPL